MLCLFLLSCNENTRKQPREGCAKQLCITDNDLLMDNRVDSLYEQFFNYAEEILNEYYKKKDTFYYYLYASDLYMEKNPFGESSSRFAFYSRETNDSTVKDKEYRVTPLFYISYKNVPLYIYSGIEFFFKADEKMYNDFLYELEGRGMGWSTQFSASGMGFVRSAGYSYHTMNQSQWGDDAIWITQPCKWIKESATLGKNIRLQYNFCSLEIDNRLDSIFALFTNEDTTTNYIYEMHIANLPNTYDLPKRVEESYMYFTLTATSADDITKKDSPFSLFYIVHNDIPIYIRSKFESIFKPVDTKDDINPGTTNNHEKIWTVYLSPNYVSLEKNSWLNGDSLSFDEKVKSHEDLYNNFSLHKRQWIPMK